MNNNNNFAAICWSMFNISYCSPIFVFLLKLQLHGYGYIHYTYPAGEVWSEISNEWIVIAWSNIHTIICTCLTLLVNWMRGMYRVCRDFQWFYCTKSYVLYMKELNTGVDWITLFWFDIYWNIIKILFCWSFSRVKVCVCVCGYMHACTHTLYWNVIAERSIQSGLFCLIISFRTFKQSASYIIVVPFASNKFWFLFLRNKKK